MRTSSWVSWGACIALSACGGSDSATTVDLQAPPGSDAVDALPPQNTEVGPVCPQCLSAGGETSDFDGGRVATCADFMLRAPASDAEVELAGYAVAAHRSRLARSFETSVRWTDLTASSAQPRPSPIAGYMPETAVRGSVTTGNIQKVFLDPARCSDAAQCTWNAYYVLDCTSSMNPSYSMATEVTLATDDGAVNQVFQSAVVLRASLPDLVTANSAGSEAAFSFAAYVDIADVQGTLRIEPLPGVEEGTLMLFMNVADDVRGRLSVNLTTAGRGKSEPGATSSRFTTTHSLPTSPPTTATSACLPRRSMPPTRGYPDASHPTSSQRSVQSSLRRVPRPAGATRGNRRRSSWSSTHPNTPV